MANEYTVTAIEAVVGGGSKFSFAKNSPERLILTSTSAVIQSAVLGAFLTEALVEPETEGATTVVRRIDAFEAGKPGPLILYGDYQVARIATQRAADSGVDHLEVFLVQSPSPNQTPYNVYDPLLQQLLVAAFQQSNATPTGFSIEVGFNGNDLISVRIGEKATKVHRNH